MKNLQHILSNVYKAIDDYNMIDDNDVIAVGLSGGKDSITTLYALNNLKLYYPKKFSIIALTVDMRFENIGKNKFNGEELRKLCENLNIPYYTIDTDIAEIVFKVRNEKNPCSLCANLRRGYLCSKAKELGANKLALGHNFDDVVETFMLNLFFEGRMGCFSPKTILEEKDLTVIRPLIYCKESSIKHFVNTNNLPVIKSDCPENKFTERENMKALLINLEKQNKGLRHRIFKAIQKSDIDGFGIEK